MFSKKTRHKIQFHVQVETIEQIPTSCVNSTLLTVEPLNRAKLVGADSNNAFASFLLPLSRTRWRSQAGLLKRKEADPQRRDYGHSVHRTERPSITNLEMEN